MNKQFPKVSLSVIRSGLILAAGFYWFCAVPLWAAEKTLPPEIAGWYLLWHDEFDGPQVDTSKWLIEDAALEKNAELQYYAPDEVFIEDGALVLRSQRRSMGRREYTSGLVETKGRFAFQYGRVEIRARMPHGRGLWPALWMLPASGKWPPEIDILEVIGHQPNVAYMNVHWGTWPDKKNKGSMFIGPDFSADFHVFALEWNAQELIWYIDGVEQFRVSEYVPAEPFFIILNTAVGGNWPGSPNKRTQFPQFHRIDYVRVYARDIPGTYFISTAAENGKTVRTPEQERYEHGQTVSLSAHPGIGFMFKSWQGDIDSADNPLRITADKHLRLQAVFAPSPEAPLLLSRAKPARVSSEENPSWSGRNINDGDKNTRWSSHYSDPQSVDIDLGRRYLVQAIRLNWEAAFARGYELQSSDDGKEWQTFYRQDAGTGGIEEITDLNVAARYIALYCFERATRYGYSLWEMEIFGKELSAE